MRTQPSLASISAVDGWALVRYRGCPVTVIKDVARVVASAGVPGDGQVWQTSWNGMVRRTPGGADADLAASEDLLAVFNRDRDGPPGGAGAATALDDGYGAAAVSVVTSAWPYPVCGRWSAIGPSGSCQSLSTSTALIRLA